MVTRRALRTSASERMFAIEFLLYQTFPNFSEVWNGAHLASYLVSAAIEIEHKRRVNVVDVH
jgi:hypothetical protein